MRGKPIGVCEHSGGIILAASREAKKQGIKTGTPTWEAKKICPQIILLPVDPAKIRATSSRFYRIAEEYSDDVEHVSVDEVSINLTGVCFTWEEALQSAHEIKQKMKEKMGEFITGTVGIAENRLLAKIATNLQKPNGLVLILPDNEPIPTLDGRPKVVQVSELYEKLDLIDIPGIGPRLKRSLRYHGITTLKQLADTPLDVLHSWYGITGVWMHDLSHFRDAWRQVDLDDRGVKSVGHQYALGKKNALFRKDIAMGLLWKLAEKVTARMRAGGYTGSAVSVYMGYARTGGGVGGSRRVNGFFDDTPSVIKVAEGLLGNVNFKNGISYIHITVSGISAKAKQGMLFPEYEKADQIPQTMDQINNRHGDFTVMYAPTLAVEEMAGDTVGFGRTRERTQWREE